MKTVEKKTFTVVLTMKFAIATGTVLFLISCNDSFQAKSCDLVKALNSISLNYTVPCIYDGIDGNSKKIVVVGTLTLVLNIIIFILDMIFPLLDKRHYLTKMGICIVVLLPFFLSIYLFGEYMKISSFKTKYKDVNYVQLHSNLKVWLEIHYTSDNIRSNNMISNDWNKFFIKYDCCAINQVVEKANDFNSTPWCTISGSCQAMVSHIPKTCCKYVSEDDYESAPSACHSAVTPGTFKSSCMDVIKKLSVVNIDEEELRKVMQYLPLVLIVELIVTIFVVSAAIFWLILYYLSG